MEFVARKALIAKGTEFVDAATANLNV